MAFTIQKTTIFWPPLKLTSFKEVYKMVKRKPKPREFVKAGLVQARLDTPQMQMVVEKALVYTKGNVSEFVRQAVLNYRPLKKSLLK